jgi:hypothetical protein
VKETLANNPSLMFTWLIEINEHWAMLFSPVTTITLNETTFSWTGQIGTHVKQKAHTCRVSKTTHTLT